MPDPMPDTCWVLHDGGMGNRRQALALAAALEVPVREWSLALHGPSRWLAPRRWLPERQPFGEAFSAALAAAPPSLVIGCGRVAALATRLAREGGAKAVQILDPRMPTRNWDLVIAPEHDGLEGDNVIAVLGSLNPVDSSWLRQGREDTPTLGQLDSPRTALLLGGPTRATRFERVDLQQLCAQLEQWRAREGGSLMICGSRRTPREWLPWLRARFEGAAHRIWLDHDDGDNPFAGVLGWADRIVVTPDSVNMLSEACSTEVPVYVAAPERAGGKIARFIAELVARGRLHALSDSPVAMSTQPLQETRRVALQVRDRLSLR